MKTIGQILRSARATKKYTLSDVEKITKIRVSFIKKIEDENWQGLPPFPTVLGFVKSLGSALDLDPSMVSAVLKRDYPPKKLTVTPKPDISSRRPFGPRVAFFAGVLVFALVIIGYLGFQYRKFVSAPELIVESPKDGQEITASKVLVFGKTDRDAKITVNNQPVLVTLDGNFSVSIDVVKETKEIVVKAISRSGKETEVKRMVEVK